MNGYRDYLRAVFIGALVFLALIFATPADGHTGPELQAWETEWEDRAAVRLTPKLIAERRRMIEAHPWYYNPQIGTALYVERPASPAVPRNVEDWRPLVSRHFRAADVDRALCLVWHESRGDPSARNPRSGATGLFQVMPFWAEHYGGDLTDPETNTAIAAAIRDAQGWTAWSPYNRGLCR